MTAPPPTSATSLGNRQSPVHFVAAVNIRLGMVGHIPTMRRMVGRTQRSALGIVHIPKTGGSAIRAAIAGVAACDLGQGYFDAAMVAGTAVDHLPDETRHQFVTSEILRDLCETNRIIIGHYPAPALLDAGCRSVATQVREPRSRLLSLYRYWQSQTPESRHSWGEWGATAVDAAITLSLEDFLCSQRAWAATENQMARQLLIAEVPRGPGHARRLTTHALGSRSRYGRLRDHLAVAEWSQDSERFFDRIRSFEPQFASSELNRVNETVVVGAPQEIGDRCIEGLRARTDLDTALLARLMSDGLLPYRSNQDLDAEFEQSAGHLGFTLAI